MLFHKQKQKLRERSFLATEISSFENRNCTQVSKVFQPKSERVTPFFNILGHSVIIDILCILNASCFYYTTPVLFHKKSNKTEHICYIKSSEHIYESLSQSRIHLQTYRHLNVQDVK